MRKRPQQRGVEKIPSDPVFESKMLREIEKSDAGENYAHEQRNQEILGGLTNQPRKEFRTGGDHEVADKTTERKGKKPDDVDACDLQYPFPII
jgi:hypothetical protein